MKQNFYQISENPEEFLAHFRGAIPEWKISFLPEHESTQLLAKTAFDAGMRENSLFFVRRQLSGRGRHDRKWISSPEGLDITMTLLVPLKQRMVNVSLMSIIGGLSIVEILRDSTGSEFAVKWPNDIYFENSKVGGIISELLVSGKDQAVAMGIGLNANSKPTDFPSSDFMYKVDTISNITRTRIHLANLMSDVVIKFERNLYLMEKGSLLDIETKWHRFGWNLGKEIKYREFGGEWQKAYADTITPEGYLILKDNNGQGLKVLVEGDVSPVNE